MEILQLLRSYLEPLGFEYTIPPLLVTAGSLRGLYRRPEDNRLFYTTSVAPENINNNSRVQLTALLNTNLRELYNLEGDSFRDNTLVISPEHSLSLGTCYFNNKHESLSPWKLFYLAPCFRNEASETRLRVFTQLGVDVYSSERSKYEDTEQIVRVFSKVLTTFNLEYTLLFSNLIILREVLKLNLQDPTLEKLNYLLLSLDGHLTWNLELESLLSNFPELTTSEILRDIFINRSLETLLLAYRESPNFDISQLENLSNFSRLANTQFCPFIVRGLDFYEGLVYEFIENKTQITFLGGGEIVLGGPVYSTGGAIGVDRLLTAIERI